MHSFTGFVVVVTVFLPWIYLGIYFVNISIYNLAATIPNKNHILLEIPVMAANN